MARWETCGNDYDEAMRLVIDGQEHVFDSIECAIEAVAPRCANCGCRIIGHGAEADGSSSAVRTAHISRASSGRTIACDPIP